MCVVPNWASSDVTEFAYFWSRLFSKLSHTDRMET
jgi:hypothetical protein